MLPYSNDYLLNKKIKIFQPLNGYRASTDAILLSSMVTQVKQGNKILDVGSGTGPISLCLAERFKNLSPEIFGIDIQNELVELANLSAKENNFNFLQFINADIRHNVPLKNCSFQHVITNPPYTDHDLPSPNPSKATAHNMLDFSLTEWLKFCIKMTAPFGFFYIINRAEALNEIISTLYGKMGNMKIIPLFSKNNQNAKRVIVIAQKDSKAPTLIYKGITLHLENGNYSPEAEAILRHGKSFFDISS